MQGLDDYLTNTPEERTDPRCDDCPAAEYGCTEPPSECVKPERVCGGCRWCVMGVFAKPRYECRAIVPMWADCWPFVSRGDNADECDCWEER